MYIPPDIRALFPSLVEQARAEGIEKYGVGSGIVWNGHLLIVTRASIATEDILPDHHEIAGGGIEPGEDVLDALMRETMEETGLELAKVHHLAGIMNFPSFRSGKPVRQFNFIVEPTHDQVILNPTEHVAHRWLHPSEKQVLDELLISPKMKQAILGILDMI